MYGVEKVKGVFGIGRQGWYNGLKDVRFFLKT